MPLRKSFFTVCLIVSALCLAAGYASVGQWIGAAVALMTGPAWLLVRRRPGSWLPALCLMGSAGVAVVGMLSGVPFLWMICGAGLALAVWDLLLLNSALGKGPYGEQTRQFEISHLRSLALALGGGLAVALLGRSFELRIPFAGLVVLVILAILGLERAWGYIGKNAGN